MNDVSDIISKYDDVISKMISLYRVRAKLYGIDIDDLRQDCRIEVWKCLKKKPESDPYFIPYLRTSLRRRIRTLLIEKSENCSQRTFDEHKKRFSTVADLREQYIPEDYAHSVLFSYNDPTEDNVIVNDFIKFCSNHSPDYGNIVKNRINGLTFEEVSRHTGIVEREVYRKIVDIKDLYKKYFGVEINEDDKPLASNKSHNSNR